MFDRVIGNDLPINPNAALKLKNAVALETSGRIRKCNYGAR